MIELIIQPAPMLIDALKLKTDAQLIELIHDSKECDRLASVAIHLTAIEVLAQRNPENYEQLIK